MRGVHRRVMLEAVAATNCISVCNSGTLDGVAHVILAITDNGVPAQFRS